MNLTSVVQGCQQGQVTRKTLDTGLYPITIIVEQLGVGEEKVTKEARFREDLEADSLDIVELIMAFEDKFGGEISDEDAQNIETVGDVVMFIESSN